MTAGQAQQGADAGAGRIKLLSAVLDEERWLAFREPADRPLLTAAEAYIAVPLRLDAASPPFGAVVVDAMQASEDRPELDMRLGLFVRETAHALSYRGFRDLIDASRERVLLEPAIKGEPGPNMPVRLGEALQAVTKEATDAEAQESGRGPRRGGARGG